MQQHQTVFQPAPHRSVARALYLGSHQHKQVRCQNDTLLVSTSNTHIKRFPILDTQCRILGTAHVEPDCTFA